MKPTKGGCCTIGRFHRYSLIEPFKEGCGYVEIGCCAHLEANTSVKQGLKLKNIMVGKGIVVIED